MTDLPERMVEAGARAITASLGWDWDDKGAFWQETRRKEARLILTAALVLAEAEGVVLVKIPPPPPCFARGSRALWGFDAAIADTLAGKVALNLDRSLDDE